MQAERIAETVNQGVHGRRRVGVGETFWQFRRYQPGDPINAIDWRQSAKRIPVYIRQHEWEAAQSVWLWRDGSPSMDYRSAANMPSKLERASLLTLALACLLIRAGEQVGLVGEDRNPSAARIVLDRLAERLAAPVSNAAPSLPPVSVLPRHAHVVWIGDFLSPLKEIDARVRAFATQRLTGHLVQIVDPAEEDLPFVGRTRFEGVEGEGQFTAGRVEALRADYTKRLAGRHTALTDIARAARWTFTSHRTDRPPETALLATYAAMAEERRRC